MLILDTINPGPAFRPESICKISFPSHIVAAGRHQGSDSSARCCRQDLVIAASARTSSSPLPLPPSRDLFDTTITTPSSMPPPERNQGSLHPSSPHLSGAAVNLLSVIPFSLSSCLGSMCELYFW
jgi:hypothetical protein